MKAGVIVFPGSNCDHDAYHVVKHVLRQECVFLWHEDRDLQGVDLVIVPGGFSYGDYLRCGSIARFAPVMEEVKRHASRGNLVLGICNGFQILQEAGLLPGVLLRNAGLKFLCQDVYVRTENTKTPFTSRLKRGQVLRMPIAHNDGNFFLRDTDLDELEENGQVVFRYCDPKGNLSPDWNPNGSARNIAGIVNRKGNVLGLMPHPERAAEDLLGSADGLLLFQSLVEALDRV